jgi:hypothetical protein
MLGDRLLLEEDWQEGFSNPTTYIEAHGEEDYVKKSL